MFSDFSPSQTKTSDMVKCRLLQIQAALAQNPLLAADLTLQNPNCINIMSSNPYVILCNPCGTTSVNWSIN